VASDGVQAGSTAAAIVNTRKDERQTMSDHKPPPARVPDGVARFVTTRQMPPNEKGFVGFETVWKPFQKEAEYKTPKRP
jgi:hypothetical protein